MKKTILGGLVGGVILLVWGFLSWTVLHFHDPTVKRIAKEDDVLAALRSNLDARGVYVFPSTPAEISEKPAEEREAAVNAWLQKYRSGPLGLIVYHPDGSEPFMLSQILIALIVNVVVALFATWFLARSTALASSYLARVAFCGMLGIFASFAVHLPYWNWMYFPFDYTTAMVADGVLGWVLAGLGIAAIMKPPKVEAA